MVSSIPRKRTEGLVTRLSTLPHVPPAQGCRIWVRDANRCCEQLGKLWHHRYTPREKPTQPSSPSPNHPALGFPPSRSSSCHQQVPQIAFSAHSRAPGRAAHLHPTPTTPHQLLAHVYFQKQSSSAPQMAPLERQQPHLPVLHPPGWHRDRAPSSCSKHVLPPVTGAGFGAGLSSTAAELSFSPGTPRWAQSEHLQHQGLRSRVRWWPWAGTPSSAPQVMG